FATLNEALSGAPDEGALIQLVGNGPFPLSPLKLSAKTRVVIEPQNPADASSAPLVVLLPAEKGSTAKFVELSNTTLELRKIHLGFDATGRSADLEDALLSVDGGDLFMQDCSFSARGVPAAPLTAIRISGGSGRSDARSDPRIHVLIENTLVRGNGLTAIAVATEHLDLGVRGSLFWSGSAPALRFSPMARSDADSARE